MDGNVQEANNTVAGGEAQGLARRAVADGNMPGIAMRSDTDCRRNPMVSREEALPYAYLTVDPVPGTASGNQKSHFSVTRIISE